MNTINTTTYFFEDVEFLADNIRTNYYYKFLQSWVAIVCPNYRDYDKFIFWFDVGQLSKVEVMHDQKIVKSFSRDTWLDPVSIDLDRKNNTETNLYTKEYISNEKLFFSKIVRHPAATIIGEDLFIVDVIVKDYALNAK